MSEEFKKRYSEYIYSPNKDVLFVEYSDNLDGLGNYWHFYYLEKDVDLDHYHTRISHRLDGPAFEYESGKKWFYLHGSIEHEESYWNDEEVIDFKLKRIFEFNV